MIRVVLWIIDVGVMLQMHPRKHWEGKDQHQRTSMSHQGIHYAVAMGSIMTSIVNYCPRHVYRDDVHAKA